jgi:hypothetical protein
VKASGSHPQAFTTQRTLQGPGGMPWIFTPTVENTVAFAHEPDVEGLDVSYFHFKLPKSCMDIQ